MSAVRDLVQRERVRSIVDIGCGDFRVGSQIASLGLDYTGIDLVPGLIERNYRRFANDRVRFLCMDVTRDVPPNGDIAIVRQVFQHLSNAQITSALSNLKDFPQILITEHHAAPGRVKTPNLDKPHGGCTRVADDSGVFLDQPPFSLPAELILEETVLEPLVAPGETFRTYLLSNNPRA